MEQPSPGIGVVSGETLVYQLEAQELIVPIGSPTWYAWLEQAHSFSFRSDEGTFTAHKARASNRRGGWYWYAYCHRHGHFFRFYLGASSRLTPERLRETARQLSLRGEALAPELPGSSFPPAERTARSSERRQAPFLATKCHLPRLPMQHVSRAHLVALLEKAIALPLTLVSAPAGSGKTTLLAEWAGTTKMPVAWLSLETADSDPLRFLSYLFAALRTLDVRIGREAGTLLGTYAALDLESVLSSLVNDLTRYLTADAALVLDDYHLLESEVAYTPLRFLLEHLPEHLHLVLGTRVDPPFPLARLRARGQLSEIRSGTLRFATTEMKTFLHEMELELAEDELSRLEERTEGWIAGIQLAALALQGHHDPTAFLREFRGNHRFILEYLSEEILARQAPRVRAFLLQTSILARLSGSLCDAVTGESGSQAILEELRRANLFVSALDETGAWYCYHALFAEGLRHLLVQQEPALFPQLCVRASAWYEAREMLFEACEYALQARDFSRAVPLIERQVHELIGGHVAFSALRRWLDQLPPDVITSRPLLGVVSTWTLLADDEQSERLEHIIARLQQNFQEHAAEKDLAGWVEARVYFNFTLSMQALNKNDTEQAMELARQTLQGLPEDAPYLQHLASLGMSLIQGTLHRLRGDFAAAERILIEASTLTQALDYPLLNMIATPILVEMYEAQGELHKIARLYQQPLQVLHSTKEAPPELAAWLYTAYAKLQREWNRLDEAENSIELALAAERRIQFRDLSLNCRLIQQGIMQARGRYEEALQLLCEIEKELPGKQLAMLMVLARTRLLLMQGKEDEALPWLRESGLSYDDPLPELPDEMLFAQYMTLARVHIAQGRRSPAEAHLTQALALLGRFSALYEPAGFTGRVIEILALTSLALQAQGETQSALASLRRAVSLAEPAGYVRVFADEGEQMARLLARLSFQKPATAAYLRTLLEATAPGSAQDGKEEARRKPPVVDTLLPEPLSAREMEALELLAAGASNRDIAARLVITPNTAKRHVKHILAKLAATNRTQAVTRARELHLL